MLLGNLLLYDWDVLSRAGADIQPSNSCVWTDTNPAFSSLSPVPYVKSCYELSLLAAHNFLGDVRRHDKLKHLETAFGNCRLLFLCGVDVLLECPLFCLAVSSISPGYILLLLFAELCI